MDIGSYRTRLCRWSLRLSSWQLWPMYILPLLRCGLVAEVAVAGGDEDDAVLVAHVGGVLVAHGAAGVRDGLHVTAQF